MRKVYDNVSSSRLSCMRREVQRQIRQFASQSGYNLERLSMPEGDNVTWRAVISKGSSRMEFALKVSRSNNKLTLEVLKVPPGIPTGAAIRRADIIYRNCG